MSDLFDNKDRQLIAKSLSQSTELSEPLTRLYNSNPIRTARDERGEEVWVVIDVLSAMGIKNPRQYWYVTKRRMIAEGVEESTICLLVKVKDANGKTQETQAMTIPQLLRMLQSLPSKKGEPFRQYMAEAGYILAKEAQNPDLAIQRGMDRYKAMGMPEEQAKLRARSVIHRKELTDKWASHGISAPHDFARLTDRESKGVFGKTTGEMKKNRNLPAYGNLRDKMTKPELTAQDVADVAISLLIDKHNPYGYRENCTEVDKGSAVGARLLADLQRTLEA